VITTIDIENLRGIHAGKLEGLTPLVVLVGPNGSGKSTILDAMLIGGSRRPAASAGYAVQRRIGMRHGARWLLYQGGEHPGRVTVEANGSMHQTRKLSWTDSDVPAEYKAQLAATGNEGPYSAIRVNMDPPLFPDRTCAFAADNEYFADDDVPGLPGLSVWLVDPRKGRSLHDLYSRLSEHGRRQALLDLLVPLVPGLRLLEILTEHGSARLNLTFDDRSIPVALAGDGIQALIRLALELAVHPQGTALLEEPEAHQHPAAITASANAIAAGVRSGLQIILTTHSLELIDALVAALRDDEIDLLSVYRLKLDRGKLLTSHFGGADVLGARGEIGDDLR
jgi:predicted ATPase